MDNADCSGSTPEVSARLEKIRLKSVTFKCLAIKVFDTKNQLGEEKKGFTSALQSIQRTHLRPQQCPIDHVTHPFPSGSLHV